MNSEKHRVWTGLAAALLTAMLAAIGAAASGPLGAAHGVCEGQADGKRTVPADPAESDSAYLTQLGLMRGHLSVGVELYRAGQLEAAVSHMKHPQDELYASMKGALEKRGAPQFDRQLEILARRVEENAGTKAVNAAYKDVQQAIGKAEDVIPKPSAYIMGQVIHQLVRHAAAEYGEAVSRGKVVNAHEYQDAMGFVRIARDWLKKLERSGANATVVNVIRLRVDGIEPAWPSVIPPKEVTVEPSALHRAAAQIETAATDLVE